MSDLPAAQHQAKISAVPPLREPLPFSQVTSQLMHTVAATNKCLA